MWVNTHILRNDPKPEGIWQFQKLFGIMKAKKSRRFDTIRYMYIIFSPKVVIQSLCGNRHLLPRYPETVKIFFIQTFCDDSWFQNSLCNCHFHQFNMSYLWFWLSGEEKCSMLSITTLKNSILKSCQIFFKNH